VEGGEVISDRQGWRRRRPAGERHRLEIVRDEPEGDNEMEEEGDDNVEEG